MSLIIYQDVELRNDEKMHCQTRGYFKKGDWTCRFQVSMDDHGLMSMKIRHSFDNLAQLDRCQRISSCIRALMKTYPFKSLQGANRVLPNISSYVTVLIPLAQALEGSCHVNMWIKTHWRDKCAEFSQPFAVSIKWKNVMVAEGPPYLLFPS